MKTCGTPRNRRSSPSGKTGAITFDDQIKTGKARLKGNHEVYEQLKTMLVHFDLGFEMMPGTGTKDLTSDQKPFEQEEPGDTAGG